MIGRPSAGVRNYVTAVTLLAFFSHVGSGCSMALVTGPPTEPQPNSTLLLECTTTDALPVADAIGAALAGFGTGVPLVQSSADVGAAQVPFIAVGAAMMTLLFYSSLVGFERTSACREAKKREAAMPPVVRHRVVAPAPPPPPSAPPEPAPPPPPPLTPQKADTE